MCGEEEVYYYSSLEGVIEVDESEVDFDVISV